MSGCSIWGMLLSRLQGPEAARNEMTYSLGARLRLQLEDSGLGSQLPTSMESQFSVGNQIVLMHSSCCLHSLDITRSPKKSMRSEKNLLNLSRGPVIFLGTAM